MINGLERGKFYLVTDSHRGIYAGELVDVHEGGNAMTIIGRHCFSFCAHGEAEDGTFALATLGPAKGSRCGPTVQMLIRNIATATECSAVAREAWEVASWR